MLPVLYGHKSLVAHGNMIPAVYGHKSVVANGNMIPVVYANMLPVVHEHKAVVAHGHHSAFSMIGLPDKCGIWTPVSTSRHYPSPLKIRHTAAWHFHNVSVKQAI